MSEDSETEEEGFPTLVRTIDDRLEDINNKTYEQPALFIENLLIRSGEQYQSLFTIMRKMCEDPDTLTDIEFGEDRSEENGRFDVFNVLQGIERDYARIAELPFQHELYYFVKDVQNDLEINSDVVVLPGNSAEVFVERSGERYEPVIKSKLKYYSEIDDDHRIIEYQRTELKNPESYPLLIHELFHVFISENREGVDQIDQILNEIESQLEPGRSKYATEILVDLLSVNYTGPIYVYTMSKMPEKVGKHTDLVHPNQSERESYLIKYLNYIEERNARLPIANMDVISKAKSTVRESDTNEILSDFEHIQSMVETLLEDLPASIYHEECHNIKTELGMPDASNKQVRDVLYELFLYSETDNEADKIESGNDPDQQSSDTDPDIQKPNVAVPIRPVFLLNLLLEDDRESSKLYETYLPAFKKWYVRKQTSIIRGRDIDQTPERKRHIGEDLGQF